MDWDKLKTFHAAAQAGSLTKAADMLGLSQSAVSRQIAALEDDLGVTLFHRHARGLIPTEPGNLLYEAAREIHGKVAVAEARVHDARDEPSGELKVTAPTALGAIWLASRLTIPATASALGSDDTGARFTAPGPISIISIPLGAWIATSVKSR